jgi:hypothetical protein
MKTPNSFFLASVMAPILLIGSAAIAQTPTADATKAALAALPAGTADEKSQLIIQHAIDALGGSAYLNVKTVVGKGFYTAFNDGVSQLPTKFLDYIEYPDRERTEFVSLGIKTIQANSGNSGWVFDGAVKTIKDQNQTQVDDFKHSMRTGFENILRGWWKQEGGKVVYVGRREAGLAKRNETIRLTYPDGYWIEYEFGARDYLPSKISYKRSRKNLDSGDMEETTEEDQLLKFISIEGVNAPWVVDHFTNSKQTSRINYESIQYNQKFTDNLFAKPENVKAIK